MVDSVNLMPVSKNRLLQFFCLAIFFVDNRSSLMVSKSAQAEFYEITINWFQIFVEKKYGKNVSLGAALAAICVLCAVGDVSKH